MNLSFDIQIGDSTKKVELITLEGNKIKISIDGEILDVDLVTVGNGVYSIILDNESYNVELLREINNKKYYVSTLFHSYNIEIIDAESKYQKNRNRGRIDEHIEKLISPLPGRIAKILVQVGDHLKAGDTAIIVESMKMYSEYKVKKDRIIKEILVKEGEIVDTNQAMIIFE